MTNGLAPAGGKKYYLLPPSLSGKPILPVGDYYFMTLKLYSLFYFFFVSTKGHLIE